MNCSRALKSRKRANSENMPNISYIEIRRSDGRTPVVRESRPVHRFGRSDFSPNPGFVRLAFRTPLRYHVAMNNESVENIARKLAEAVPEGLRSVREDLENNFRAVLSASLNKLDLVTREEFEVQEAVLAKTRAKLEVLEQVVEDLEKD